jgi:hypothetical protein
MSNVTPATDLSALVISKWADQIGLPWSFWSVAFPRPRGEADSGWHSVMLIEWRFSG